MDRKKIILLSVFFSAAAALYLYIYRDAILPQPIQISHTFRLRMAMARRVNRSTQSFPIIPTFTLGRDYRLTSIKVIRLDELKAKGFAYPLWEVVSDSGSAPTRVFLYGMTIGDMHPRVDGVGPDPLETNVAYRLLVTAGCLKGQHDFTISGRDAPAPPAAADQN